MLLCGGSFAGFDLNQGRHHRKNAVLRKYKCGDKMIVADIMQTGILAVQPQTSLAQAASLMVQHHISGLPVRDDAGKLVGILTEGDLLRRPELGTSQRQPGWLKGLLMTAALAGEYIHSHGRTVGDVMTRNPVYVRPEMSLTRAAALMQCKKIKRLPVLRDRALVGMLTRFDLLTALSARLNVAEPNASDADIAASIKAELAQQIWAPKFGILVSVSAGCVSLSGQAETEEQVHALEILVLNTGGVKALRSALIVATPSLPLMAQEA